MIIDPAKQDLVANYKLLIGSVLPRPIAFVSSVGADGTANLAPFSFFTAAAPKPPTVCFAPLRRFSDGQEKDTLCNIRATKEFVVNIVTGQNVELVNEAAAEFAPEIDEFEAVGFTPGVSEIVKPPRVLESPISFECKLTQIVPLGAAEAGGGALVIGEVVCFHVADHLLKDGRIDTEALDPIGRLAGAEFTTLGRRFSLERKR